MRASRARTWRPRGPSSISWPGTCADTLPSGKPGDHPYTDSVIHHLAVYSPSADGLVREIAKLADERTRRELADLLFLRFNVYDRPDVAELERVLTDLRDRLRREASARGWERDA